MQKKNIAVILAAGSGERAGYETPKQLLKLAGRAVVEHVIQVFQDAEEIHEILVVASSHVREAIERIVIDGRFAKVSGVITGGSSRAESSIAAIRATQHYTAAYCVRLIFHDAVRPLVTSSVIRDVVSALDTFNAVDVAIPATDTIVVADPTTNTIASIPDRNALRSGQTPQGFAHKVIADAYEKASADPGFTATDDCGVVLRYMPEERIYLINGETSNVKLTYRQDLHILDKLFQLRSHTLRPESKRFALAALKGKVIVVFGGTSGIGEEICRLARAYQAVTVPGSSRVGVDVAEYNAVREFLASIRQQHGRIDYVVNCAAVLTKKALVDMTMTDIRRAVEVNYLGAINVAVAAFDALRESQGQLLNFTSSSYTYGRSLYSLYSSSKAAVVNLTQALADEWHASSVRVNCINPERTKTPMRVRAFGIEPDGTLLESSAVAEQALLVLLGEYTGQVFDVRLAK